MSILLSSRRSLAGMFLLSMALPAQTFTTIYNFGSQDHDGVNPRSRIIFGPQGQLYGATSSGGAMSRGTVYELVPPASARGVWTEVVLHSFGGPDGQNPNAALLLGPNGALYGVTVRSTSGYGTAFELDPPTVESAHWSYGVIHPFTESDGSHPAGALAFGIGQSLYGSIGRLTGAPAGEDGALYSLTPPSAPGGAWTETILSTFTGFNGSNPVGTLAVSGNGTLFGATAFGGNGGGQCQGGCGLVFSLTPPAISGGSWTYRVLYEFGAQAGDGQHPSSGLVLTPTGVLYGTTKSGDGGSMGTVFALTPAGVAGAPMAETVLHVFNGSDGAQPAPGLVPGPNGVLYGTTLSGGANGHGTVFVLTPPAAAGGSWNETVLHNFTYGADGGYPGGLALSADGILYGTTTYGGAFGKGTVYTLVP